MGRARAPLKYVEPGEHEHCVTWLRWFCVTRKASVFVRRKHCVCVLVLVKLNIAQLQIALPLLWCQPMVTYLGLFLAFGQLITKI